MKTKYGSKRQKLLSSALVAGLLGTSISSGAIIQSVAGPINGSDGGAGTVIVDTSNDTGDWITNLNAGQTTFIRFDWTISNNNGESGTGGFYGGMGVFGAGELLLVGNGWESLNYGAGAGPTIENSATAYTVGETVSLLVQLSQNTGGLDTWKVWVNPDGSSLESAPDIERTDWNLDGISQFTSRAGGSPGAATISNLTVASSFSDVVPEPSSSVMLLTGLAGMALRRRR